MINLTKLNNKEFILNGELIKFIENVPDTLITLINGEKVFVLESTEEVILKVIDMSLTIDGCL